MPDSFETSDDKAPDFDRLGTATRRLSTVLERPEAALGRNPGPDRSPDLSAALDQIRQAAGLIGSLEDRSSGLQAKYDELSVRSEAELRAAESRIHEAETRADRALERARVAEERLREAKEQLDQLTEVVHEELQPRLGR